MQPIPELRRREVAAFFEFVAKLRTIYDTEEEVDHAIECLSSHVVGEYESEDFLSLSETLTDADASGSFVFLGREASDRADVIEQLDAAGHEIVQHGHRHIRWDDLDYDMAHDNLEKGISAIEDHTGIVAEGMFVPFKSISEAGLRAASDLGIEWVLGETDGEVPDDITLFDSVYPHDTRLLEERTPHDEAFDEFREKAQDGETFLFHPNMIEYHGATDEFEGWISDVQPVTVAEQLSNGGVSAVYDSIRPFRVE